MIVPGQSAPAAGSAVAGSPLPTVPDHDLIRVIGRGAYGEVWLARHTRLGTMRAIKIIRRELFGDARPFTREFEGIRKYEPISRSHPNLVSILHVGGTDDCFYYVMELADDANVGQASSLSGPKGEEITEETGWKPVPLYSPHTLRSELKQQGALPIDRVLEIAHALASALAHLHAHKLVHRDVKPSNVIFVGGVPKLADIGLVAGVDDARSLVGTEGYVPFHGAGTPSADCYALGKLLYELSTGHDRTAWPEPPADLATRPDRERLLELNAILHRACAPDPRQRYADSVAMLTDLERLQAGKSVRRQRAVERRWAIGKKVGLAIAALALFTAAGSWFLKSVGTDSYNSSVARTLSPEMVGTKNLDAFKLYEKARVCFRRFTIEGEKLAREYLNEAIRLDPDFVAAYDLLFLGYVNSWALPDEAG